MRKVFKSFLGFIAIFIGLSIMANIIGFGDSLLGALFLFGMGVFFYLYFHRWLGLLFFVLSAIVFVDEVLGIDIAGILFASLFIYIGYRLLTNKKETFRRRQCPPGYKFDARFHPEKDWLDEEIEQLHKQQKQHRNEQRAAEQANTFRYEGYSHIKAPNYHKTLIGDIHFMNHRFELNDMNFSYVIGDVKIDLSKAIIPEGESIIAISGLIGDVDIYIPYDLQVSVSASATLGDLEILGYRQSGFNRQIHVVTNDYDQARRKVKISISSFIGDIDVRHL